jgi:hypothetical protein
MRTFILLACLISSLQSGGQTYWEGKYAVKYTSKTSEFNKSEINVWIAEDSLNKIRWSFSAFFKEAWQWENSGYCTVVDSNYLELFVVQHKNSSTKKEKRIADKLYKIKPLYIITKVDNILFIESKKNSRANKLELVKL